MYLVGSCNWITMGNSPIEPSGVHRDCVQADGTRGCCGKNTRFSIPTPAEGQESLPSPTAPTKLPGMSEKEKRNMQHTCLEVYWRGVYRPGEVGVHRES